MKIFLKNKKSRGGYTIIETMVAISVFLVVIMFGMTALLNAYSVHRKLQDMRSIIDNINFVMEDISRNMRVGYNFQCFRKGVDTIANPVQNNFSSALNALNGLPRSCQDGWALAFEPSTGNPAVTTDQWVYYLDGSGKVWKSTQGAAVGSFIQLTPDEVVIDQFSGFSVLGAPSKASGDSQQPIIKIWLSGRIIFKGVATPFSIQTSVSQRAVDT